MAKDSKNKNATKEQEKKMKDLAKEEKMKKKLMEKEEKRKSKEEKKKIKEDERRSKEERKKMNSKTDIHSSKKESKKSKSDGQNKMETQSEYSEVRSVQSAHRTGEQTFKFRDSRFVMPRGRKGYVFPVTPGPARYPVTRINYPIMNARRQVDLTKKMFMGQSIPAYTMGIRHSELREYYNKIQ